MSEITEVGKVERRRYTAEEKAKWVEQFKQSGNNRAAFCREQGLGYLTFSQWLAKEPSVGGFRELQLVGSGVLMEVEISGGTTIRLFSGCPEKWVEKAFGNLK
jgi:transposase-like protein